MVNLVVVRGGWVGQQGWWQEVVVGGVKEVVGWGVNLVVVTRQLGGSSELGQVGQEGWWQHNNKQQQAQTSTNKEQQKNYKKQDNKW